MKWHSVVLKVRCDGLLLVPPWDHQGAQAHTHTHTHTNPLVSPRRPPETEEGTARWDTPLSCGGIGWRGRCRSSAGPSPSLAAWARNVPLCVCGSWYNVQRPTGTPLGNARFAPHWLGLDDLQTQAHRQCCYAASCRAVSVPEEQCWEKPDNNRKDGLQ